jgi:transcriptional regulator with XRE-family HTH domain
MAESSSSLGEHIRDGRVRKGLGLRELARLINKAPSYLSDIEYDRRVPSEEVLRAMCDVLDLDVDVTLGLAGRLGEEADRFLRRNPAAGVLFRRVSEGRLSDDDLKALVAQADEMAKRKRRSK